MANAIRIRVRADDDTHGFAAIRSATRNLGRDLRTQFLQTGSVAGQAFSATLNEGIGAGLKTAMSNPYVAAGLAALVAGAASAVGAALAGALTLAFGGAFVGLGVMLLKDLPEVKKKWGDTLKGIKKEFTDAAKPLLPVIETARKRLDSMASKFAPHFKTAMEAAAPHLNSFLDRMSKGIEGFGKRAFKPMMTAFNDLLDEIDIQGFFEELGDAFGNMGRAVSRNKEAVGGIFNSMLGLIPKVINALATLTDYWGKVQPFFSQIWETIKTLLTPSVTALGIAFQVMGDIMNALAGPMSLANRILSTFYNEAIKPVAEFIGRVFGPIWRGLVEGFKEGWTILEQGLVPVLKDLWQIAKDTALTILDVFLPGLAELDEKSGSAGRTIKEWIIDKMAALSAWLQEHRDDIKVWAQRIADGAIVAAKFIKGVIDRAMELWGWISRNWRLILHITGITAVIEIIKKVRELWGWVKRNWKQVVAFSIPGVAGVIKRVKDLWGWVNRNWRRVVSLSVSIAGFSTLKSAYNMITSAFAHGGVVGGGKATGGLVGAAASGGIRQNMTLVGEQGPELVDLPAGSRVRSNPDTRRLFRSSGGNGGPAQFIFKSSGRRADDLLLEILREAIHQRGGDPVAVLGG